MNFVFYYLFSKVATKIRTLNYFYYALLAQYCQNCPSELFLRCMSPPQNLTTITTNTRKSCPSENGMNSCMIIFIDR